jgi:hypothetical protein
VIGELPEELFKVIQPGLGDGGRRLNAHHSYAPPERRPQRRHVRERLPLSLGRPTPERSAPGYLPSPGPTSRDARLSLCGRPCRAAREERPVGVTWPMVNGLATACGPRQPGSG